MMLVLAIFSMFVGVAIGMVLGAILDQRSRR